jgi:hypothetical protein
MGQRSYAISPLSFAFLSPRLPTKSVNIALRVVVETRELDAGRVVGLGRWDDLLDEVLACAHLNDVADAQHAPIGRALSGAPNASRRRAARRVGSAPERASCDVLMRA